MTPMQSLKNQFDSFKNILPATFKELALNKSEPNTSVSSWCGEQFVHENKGVRSDFIKTFKAKLNDVDSYSIGFSFKYLDIPDAEHTVQVSLKVGNKEPLYYKGKEMLVAEFRTKFTETLAKLETLEIKHYKPIVELVKEEFNLLPSHHPKKQVHSQRKNKMK
jgi:hypothetical protein